MSSREKVIGLFVGVVVGLYALDSFVFSPLLERLTQAENAVNVTETALREGNEKQGESLRVRRRWRELGGDTLATDTAAAENQVYNRIRECAAAAGVSLTATKTERTDREKDFQRVLIRVTAGGTMNQMARLVYLLDHSNIPLRVSDVQLAAKKENVDDLQLQLGVSTIYLPPAKPEGTR